jgi:hypothetical protein
MNKRNWLILWSFFFLFLVNGSLCWFIWSNSSITRMNFNRLRRNMPLAEIEAILGPSESTDHTTFGSPPEGGYLKKWSGRDGEIWIIFSTYPHKAQMGRFEGKDGENEWLRQ